MAAEGSQPPIAVEGGGRRSWLRRMRALAGTVRVRTAAVAVVVVGLALLIGAVTLLGVMRGTLTRGVEAAARLRADEVAATFEADGIPSTLAIGDPEEQLVQIVDANGNVVASSPNVEGLPAVADLGRGASAEIETPIDEGLYVAVAVGADSPQGRFTVIVARSLEDVLESTQVVTGLLAIGLPLLLVLVGLTAWTMVGRALAPVEAIRSEVDEISAAQLHRRVEVPSGADEIARLAGTMNTMLARLEGSQARQRRFVSDASHELRSPVASIRQHAEVALAHPNRTTVTELAETVLAEDLRVQRLADDLLLLARADEHTLQLRRRPVDLDDVVLDEARRLRESTSLRIDTTEVSAARVNADGMGLRRVLRNVGDNAARHARGRVVFALAERDGSARLTVDDDGPGIPDAEREHVFERFVRLDDARGRDHGGTGLGLAIVAALVRAHGGSVRIVDSRLGGTRIEVHLPAGPSDA